MPSATRSSSRPCVTCSAARDPRLVRVHRIEREELVPRPLGDVFEFFSLAHNLERITPPWLSFEVLTPAPIEMRVGTQIDYRLRVHGIPLRWVSRIEDWVHNRAFVDRQIQGPYRLWHHRHEFEPRDGGTLVRDRVHYAIGLGPLGEIAHAGFVKRDLAGVFDFRTTAVRQLLG
jgi:ligand-binding SRPBCC domain-containing protein